MSNYIHNIHLEAEPEGGYTVTVPALPGCVTWGKDLEHAQQMARECIECHLEALEKAGQPIPKEASLVPLDFPVQVEAHVHV
jgi:antitoxin HicB